MRQLAFLLVLCVSYFAHGDVERGAPLPRKGFLGVQAAPDSAGVKVARAVPGGSAEKLGLREGDVILSLNGERIADPAKLVAIARTMTAGTNLEVRYSREGKEATASGKMAERPKVSEPNLDVIYDQVMSQGKRIRVIITKPKGDGQFPAVFLIGGIGAYSVDAPFANAPYGNVLGPIANAGYVTVRIDKPGQGDSEGPAYKNLSFKVEQDAYLQALRLTKTLPYVDAKRIAIFGHSMGGCFGPLVASQEPVKALIVNGTLIKSFTEYMLENTRRQSELADAGQDALDQEQMQLDTTLHYLFGESMTPTEIAAKHPELAPFVKSTFPDGETYSGVGIQFFRELSQINLAQAWRDAKCDVLSLYSENDFLSGRDDHERIAAYVNKLRPGTAEFKLLAGSDHGFTKTTSMRDSLQRWGQGGEFNPVIVQTLLAYLKKELAPSA
jgi:dienelactone hydrolase